MSYVIHCLSKCCRRLTRHDPRRETSKPTATSEPHMTLEETIEHAKRAFALKKYEQAVEHYASALELA